MREIKFRVWDGKKICSNEEGWNGSNGHVNLITIYTGYEDSNEWKDYKLMQYTGLKDKNGKEIYEGDICNEFRISRSFPEGRKRIKIIKWDEDMILDDSYGETAIGFNMGGGTLEVIGNIYENPELLNQ